MLLYNTFINVTLQYFYQCYCKTLCQCTLLLIVLAVVQQKSLMRAIIVRTRILNFIFLFVNVILCVNVTVLYVANVTLQLLFNVTL